MKPDWKDAPEWAQYAAMDDDGTWWWYELRPSPQTHSWEGVGKHDSIVLRFSNWQDTLEERPKPKQRYYTTRLESTVFMYVYDREDGKRICAFPDLLRAETVAKALNDLEDKEC